MRQDPPGYPVQAGGIASDAEFCQRLGATGRPVHDPQVALEVDAIHDHGLAYPGPLDLELHAITLQRLTCDAHEGFAGIGDADQSITHLQGIGQFSSRGADRGIGDDRHRQAS